jgi:hypothetical protein
VRHPPYEYIKKLRIKKKYLDQQCIPLDEKLWRVENYKKFIVERRKKLAQKANSL